MARILSCRRTGAGLGVLLGVGSGPALSATPHQRLQLGPVMPLRGFLEQVHWVNLEELGQQENLDVAVDLLTLPVRSEQELAERCRRILANRRDLEPVVFSMLFERFPKLSKEEILMIAGLPL